MLDSGRVDRDTGEASEIEPSDKLPPHSQVATVSRPPRPRGIKASCPGDVGLTDTLAKEEATPAVDAITHTRRQNHTVPQLYHLTPPTCPYSRT
ncbi:hypothetical protein Pmani_003406 [Petrolisthes manimaculis]|uniref:Uncharacterized protein n=1 Tax=Petrolisthes manimaculis TaxID=1843537 RepID=A0AAE1PJI6_9EUCA|nr:hypothetical protein Pmani_027467 [Petrolisthes manimaculis]KAK4306938.1 hypothetical protein Pmani_021291 [Petrolisthes manimaculis]KAK4308737.1 hypothetical protein Pmani_019581 [Petrolisthes manimaculis]KAK4309538.1 hypothetical protein Pmani_018848 [Petrolisthes manimaculis]KAK4326042.1 hypothetical protein Pmani_003406 [Petrolisthes manimaculis]